MLAPPRRLRPQDSDTTRQAHALVRRRRLLAGLASILYVQVRGENKLVMPYVPEREFRLEDVDETSCRLDFRCACERACTWYARLMRRAQFRQGGHRRARAAAAPA